MENWSTVKKYEHRYEADIAKQFLDQHDIAAFIKADDAGGLHPSLTFSSGVELQVPDDALEEAKALLEKLDSAGPHLEIVKKK